MSEKANSLPLSSLCIKEAHYIDRLPVRRCGTRIESNGPSINGHIRRLRVHILVPQLPVAKGGLSNVEVIFAFVVREGPDDECVDASSPLWTIFLCSRVDTTG
jgi:hypothetical protein